MVNLLKKKGENVARSHPKPLATTDRLHLRAFVPADAPHLYALNSNPDVIRYTEDASFLDVAAAEAYLCDYDHYSHFGFGRWAVILKREERFIGYCGLRSDENSGEVDLDFRFFADYWSQGFATEAGQAALKLGFETFNLDRIIGRSMRENLPSISVLQKLGMEFSDVREESEMLWLIYAIEKNAWRSLTSSQTATDR